MATYTQLKNCWNGLEKYSLNAPSKGSRWGPAYTSEYAGLCSRYALDRRESTKGRLLELYVPPVTLSYPQWVQYVSSGKNVLYGSGGVIPGGTIQTAFGGSGAVYRGNVRQGYGMYKTGYR